MLKKGQCSNNPSKCSIARDGTLLPYAGPNSICHECGAPLALVAVGNEEFTAHTTAPNTKQMHQNPDYDTYDERPNQAMEFAKMAALFVVVAGAVFFGLKFAKNNSNTDDSSVGTSNMVANNVTSDYQISEVSPIQIATTNAITEVKASPSQSAEVIGTLGVGTTVDINGRATVDGIDWVRVIIPNQSTQLGFVRLSELSSMGVNTLGIGQDPNLINGVATQVAPPAPKPPVIGEVVETAPSIFYINGDKANVRNDAGINSPKVHEALRGDTLTADASRTVDGKTWYRVSLPQGGQGWVSGSLLSKTPPLTANEAGDATQLPAKASKIEEGSNIVFTIDKAKIRSAPEVVEGNETAEVGRGMVSQVQAVEQKDGTIWYKVRSKRFNIDGWVEGKSVKIVE